MSTRMWFAVPVLLSVLGMLLGGCTGARPAGESTTPAPTPTPMSSSPAPSPAPPASERPSSPPSAPVTPAITIDTPPPGATAAIPFTASGTANTFEAALTIDVVDAAGRTVCVRALTATSGSGTRGTWTGTLAFPPGTGAPPLRLRAYTHSAMDGSVIDLVEQPITMSTARPDIVLTSPTCGQAVSAGGALALTGTAAVFEAAFLVDLRDAAGTALVTVPMMAQECCVHSPFSSTLTIPAGIGGLYDVVAYNLSAKDGSVEDEFSVQIEVR